MMLLLAEVVDFRLSFVVAMADIGGVIESLVIDSLDTVVEIFVKRRLDELEVSFEWLLSDLLSNVLTLNSAVLSKNASNTVKLLFC